MLERTRFDSEIRHLLPAVADPPAVREHEGPPPAPRRAPAPPRPAAPAWPPARLRGLVLFRHWRSYTAAGGAVVMDAAHLDPGFVAGPKADASCLKEWAKSAAPSASRARIAFVNLRGAGRKYTGLRDTTETYFSSVTKLGVMYPAFQLRRDLAVVAERDRPADPAALFRAARAQWAKDLSDAGFFRGNPSGALAWVRANGPKLEKIASMNASREVAFLPDFHAAVKTTIVDSSNTGRNTCIQLLGATYMNSVRAQSGKVAGLKPLNWTATAESLAALLTLIDREMLVSPVDSRAMRALMVEGATTGARTWARYALHGNDDPTDATLRRGTDSVAGKIGFLYGGPEATWWDNLTQMADASIVRAPGGRSYILVYSIPFHRKVIPTKVILPLIRSVHDCV